MRKALLSIPIIASCWFFCLPASAKAGEADVAQQEIDRKVEAYSKQQQAMKNFMAISQEHGKAIQEKHKLFLEKLKQAKTPEDKYRLRLEFNAEQQEAKRLFQEKLRAMNQQ